VLAGTALCPQALLAAGLSHHTPMIQVEPGRVLAERQRPVCWDTERMLSAGALQILTLNQLL